jgi:hypothetical protein
MTIVTTPLSFADVARAVGLRRAFDKGLAMVNVDRRACLEARTSVIRAALDVDIISDKPLRGRPGRIARKLGLERRTVQRILATL